MPREFCFPDVGEGVAEGELLQWLVEPGETVAEDQPVAEVETDKAVVEVPAPVDGTVQELHGEPGDMIPVGDVLVTFAVEGEAADSPEADAETAGDAETQGAVDVAASADSEDGSSGGRVFAPPHVKRLARELGVSLGSVTGSGPGGRVTERDVREAAASGDRVGQSTGGVDDEDTEPAGKHAEWEDVSEAGGAESDGRPGSGSAATATATETGSAADRDRTLATPATRKLADDLGVELDAVPPTERRDGEAFVTPEAVTQYAESQRQAQAADSEALSASGSAGAADSTGAAASGGERIAGEKVEREPYSGVRRTIGEAMATSRFTAPHATHHDRVDATGLVETREKLRPLAEERGVRLTYLPIVMKIVVGALVEHPIMNSMLDAENEEIVYNDEYNIGVAVATDAGLMVPVVEHVDEKSLLEVAAEVTDLLERARDRSIALEEMQGGTFTITNFGSIGGEYATPILNHPEAAILGLGAIEQRPMVEGGSLSDPGEVVARPVLPLSLSIDHRVIDGADAARFVNTLKEYVRDPTLLLD